jgi:hypothetical protein
MDPLTETNIPGRNTIVSAAMVFMAKLSFFVSVAILFDSSAIWALRRLSLCDARLNSYIRQIKGRGAEEEGGGGGYHIYLDIHALGKVIQLHLYAFTKV